MKALGFVIAACMILAVLRYAAAVLLLALSVLMLWGALRYTREFVGFIAISVALGMMEHHPYITLGLVALSAIVTAGNGEGA